MIRADLTRLEEAEALRVHAERTRAHRTPEQGIDDRGMTFEEPHRALVTVREVGGRAPGQKNLSVGETKKEIKAFFQELTIDSMRWRKNVKMHLEMAPDPREFRFWSTIALSYRFRSPR